MAQSLAALCIGFILDFILGDPHSFWHPVQGIGSLITGTEKALRKVFPDKKRSEEKSAGNRIDAKGNCGRFWNFFIKEEGNDRKQHEPCPDTEEYLPFRFGE